MREQRRSGKPPAKMVTQHNERIKMLGEPEFRVGVAPEKAVEVSAAYRGVTRHNGVWGGRFFIRDAGIP